MAVPPIARPCDFVALFLHHGKAWVYLQSHRRAHTKSLFNEALQRDHKRHHKRGQQRTSSQIPTRGTR